MSDPIVERLANNTLLLAQELRNTSKQFERTAEAVHSATEAMLATKREVHDALGPGGAVDGVIREVRYELNQVNERLAVISKDVDDVEKAAREATGAHVLVAKADTKEGLLRAFGEQPWFTQLLVVVTAVLAGGFGHWLISLIGK